MPTRAAAVAAMAAAAAVEHNACSARSYRSYNFNQAQRPSTASHQLLLCAP